MPYSAQDYIKQEAEVPLLLDTTGNRGLVIINFSLCREHQQELLSAILKRTIPCYWNH